MPYRRRSSLTPDFVATIRQWINHERPYDQPLVEQKSGPPAPFEVTDADRNFWWSFKPASQLRQKDQRHGLVSSEIDQFVRTVKQEGDRVAPNPLADPGR